VRTKNEDCDLLEVYKGKGLGFSDQNTQGQTITVVDGGSAVRERRRDERGLKAYSILSSRKVEEGAGNEAARINKPFVYGFGEERGERGRRPL